MAQERSRDEFTGATKRVVALRVGYNCSFFSCNRPTSKPTDKPNTAVVLGQAAHITAASSRGPRYDPTLTPEQRKSADNAIWLCPDHALLVDREDSRFTVSVLRHFKEAAEARARRAAEDPPLSLQDTARLVELPEVSNTYELLDIVRPQTYDFGTTFEIRQQIRLARDPGRLLDLISNLAVELWGSVTDDVVNILVVLLSCNLATWHPQEPTLAKLDSLCRIEIANDHWPHVSAVEPLAFAIGAKGYQQTHRSMLQRIVESEHWQKAQVEQSERYYGGSGKQLSAILRHTRDPFRKDLLLANDVARLMHLLSKPTPDLRRTGTAKKAIQLLQMSADVLFQFGEPQLSRKVSNVIELSGLAKYAG